MVVSGAIGDRGTIDQPEVGAVFVHKLSTGDELQRIVANDELTYGGFGLAVSVDGKTAVIGSSKRSSDVGGAYLMK